ncbi:MAG: LysE family translocator [Bacteroidaceae bacterium]|nr:LysE family translocator [Bacteroidaceae bacterium]MCF0186676.1 LysE family translocator [Bacteroidaceae bacterium]
MLIDLTRIILKGLIVGIVVSAPMGPVGVLCVQRTLNKGRWFGFVTGLGATLSDLIYALLTGLGLSFVFDLLEKGHNMFYVQLLGGIMLFFFGLYAYRSNPTKNFRPVSKNKGSLAQNFATAFLVTLSNPLIIFLFLGLFARFNFVDNDQPLWMDVFGYLTIVVGAVGWWYGLTYFINKIRDRFDQKGIVFINRFIGALVMVASVVGILFTITGNTLY